MEVLRVRRKTPPGLTHPEMGLEMTTRRVVCYRLREEKGEVQNLSCVDRFWKNEILTDVGALLQVLVSFLLSEEPVWPNKFVTVPKQEDESDRQVAGFVAG